MPNSACNLLTLSGSLDPDCAVTELLLPNGRAVRVDTLLLLGSDPFTPPLAPAEPGGTQVIPIVEEQLHVGKQTIETGKVRLIKSVGEYHETLNEPLAIRTFDVERVAFNQPVDAPPQVRHEGAITIYPVVEEQLVLTKRLVLKEEIRVTQRDTERRDTQVVTLRREHIEIERETLKPKS